MPVLILPSLRNRAADVCGSLAVTYKAATGFALNDEGYAVQPPTWARFLRVSISDPTRTHRLLVNPNASTEPITSMELVVPGAASLEQQLFASISTEHGWVWVPMPTDWLRMYVEPDPAILTADLAWSLQFFAADCRQLVPRGWVA